MLTPAKIALATTLVAITTSVAFAQDFDPNLANRYPGYAEPNTYGYAASGDLNSAPAGTFQSAPVGLQKHRNVRLQSAPVLQQRNVALPTEGRSSAGPFWYSSSGPTSGGM